jgi:WD40 repeat protein
MQTWLISIRCFLSGAILLAALQCIAAEPTTRPLPRLETGMHTASINRIATDASGRWAVTASHDKTTRVWEVASGRQLAVLCPPRTSVTRASYTRWRCRRTERSWRWGDGPAEIG